MTANNAFSATEEAMIKALLEQTLLTVGKELKKGADKGRYGWYDPAICSLETLQSLYMNAEARGDLPSALTLLAMGWFRMQYQAGIMSKASGVSVP